VRDVIFRALPLARVAAALGGRRVRTRIPIQPSNQKTRMGRRAEAGRRAWMPCAREARSGLSNKEKKLSACALLLAFAGRASPEGPRQGGTVAPVAVLRRVARADPSSRGAAQHSCHQPRIG
jgi:hypothetical protein